VAAGRTAVGVIVGAVRADKVTAALVDAARAVTWNGTKEHPFIRLAGEGWKAIEADEIRFDWRLEDCPMGFRQSVRHSEATHRSAVISILREKLAELREFVWGQGLDAMLDRAWSEATVPSPMLSR
jgi:hypothetical protein